MVRGSALLFTAMTLSVVVFLALLRAKAPRRILVGWINRLPEKQAGKLRRWTGQLVDGLTAFRKKGLIFYLAVLSLVIWSVDALALYALFLALDIALPLSAAYALLAMIIVGITLPAAPGFVGNWHFFCVLGLTLFGISRTEALTYAVLNHFISMAVMSGVDFMTIASWVGHQDGGVLIGKVYGHLANEHKKAMAERLNFGPTVLQRAANQ